MQPYCCFLHPERNYVDRNLHDRCDQCGKRLDFPLTSPPATINDFAVVKPLARGFYGAAYTATRGKLGRLSVLKISPKKAYDVFQKDFEEECRTHGQIASDTDFVVDIHDYFESLITFADGTVVDCYVAHLDYQSGPLLSSYLDGTVPCTARTAAQIAIDLLALLSELESRSLFHNDLQDRNLIVHQLAKPTRAAAVDPTIRLVAVDLGSVSAESKSGGNDPRPSDLHRVAGHLKVLVERLLSAPESVSPTEYRVASKLQDIVSQLSSDVLTIRNEPLTNYIDVIVDAVNEAESPWRGDFVLKSFNHAYNAQTLAPWFIPALLVDPDEKWVPRISSPGPLIITGMRGCGKTMLLRSLDFHARAGFTSDKERSAAMERIASDAFVGLYVSCTRLLDKLGERGEKLLDPYGRLYVAYALEAVRALRHLAELDASKVHHAYHKRLAEAVAELIDGTEYLTQIDTTFGVEAALLKLSVVLARGDSKSTLKVPPVVAFPHLATTIRKCSSLWSNATVFFLLDDVSTRYLELPETLAILAQLLFPNEVCAFKVTSEAQTLQFAFTSGKDEVEQARVGRDYDQFDLGYEVYERLRSGSSQEGRRFLLRILRQRARYFAEHPLVDPAQILGEDVSLNDIAADIVKRGTAGAADAPVYRGVAALAAVCVGDIGDVLSIYDNILRHDRRETYPIAAEIQSQCYQEFAARRLLDLARRRSALVDFARNFAQTAHRLLLVSSKKEVRLRQYARVSLTVNSGDEEFQYVRLRELVDAGIFILGSIESPRLKSRRGTPQHQFSLTFRKLLGLPMLIGLSERDRFELSGTDLERWLRDPAATDDVLTRNLAAAAEDELVDAPTATSSHAASEADDQRGAQLALDLRLSAGRETAATLPFRYAQAQECPINHEVLRACRAAVVAAGFEERASLSLGRWLPLVPDCEVTLIEYDGRYETEHSFSIRDQLKSRRKRVIQYSDTTDVDVSGPALIDTTGMAKPAIFRAVRSALKVAGVVYVLHTRAGEYYPKDEDIEALLQADTEHDQSRTLELMAAVYSGEAGPYKLVPLLHSDEDETRRRAVYAYASAKHERLLHLLDHREFDAVDIVAGNTTSARSRLSRLVAEIGSSSYSNATVGHIGTNDLRSLLPHLNERYRDLYVRSGLNFEVGLTGSKLQAVACAAASVAVKVAQAWYVKPNQLNSEQFTSGVGSSTLYRVEIGSR